MSTPSPTPKTGDDRPLAFRRQVAHHEAGHAVAAHLLGAELHHVSALASPGRQGHVSYTMPSPPRPDPLLVATQSDLIVALAATAAWRISAERLGADYFGLQKKPITDLPDERLLAIPPKASVVEWVVFDGWYDERDWNGEIPDSERRAAEATSSRHEAETLLAWARVRCANLVASEPFQAAVRHLARLLIQEGELDGAAAAREISRALWLADQAAESEAAPA